LQRLISVAVSTAVAVVIIVAAWTSTGAPARVHVVNTIGVIVAFWLPALFAGRLATLRQRWPLVLGGILVGTLVWDILSASVIVKREFFMSGVVLYPGAVLVFGSLLFGCAALTYAITKA
jgi:hypothetical protein